MNKTQNYLDELLQSQTEEINKHKWIESERQGKDIGWHIAAEEWMLKHFPSWKRHHWQQAIERTKTRWNV